MILQKIKIVILTKIKTIKVQIQAPNLFDPIDGIANNIKLAA